MFPASGSAQHGTGSGSAGQLGKGPGEPGQGSGLQDGDQAQHDRQSSAIDPGQASPINNRLYFDAVVIMLCL